MNEAWPEWTWGQTPSHRWWIREYSPDQYGWGVTNRRTGQVVSSVTDSRELAERAIEQWTGERIAQHDKEV